jgi:TonB family protein
MLARDAPAQATPDPIPLDSENAGYREYLASVHRMIAAKMRYPCAVDRATGRCEYMAANVEVDIGVFMDGRLAHVTVRESSGIAAYDDGAVKAISAASPFPPVPPALMAKAKPGSASVSIRARLKYVLTPQCGDGEACP